MYNKKGGKFYRFIADMYSRSKYAIKIGNKRIDYFNYNKGVRQGCILSSLLFNVYLDDIARILDSQIGVTDPIILSNGLPQFLVYFMQMIQC